MTSKAQVPAGVGMKMDEQPPVRLPLGSCDKAVCEARGWLTDDMTGQLRKGRLLRFAYYIDTRNQITYPVSLDGLDGALDYMVENDNRR